MSNERDELAEVIKPAAAYDFWPQKAAELALAAGYRKPRQVTTVEELDVLPAGTLIACVNLNPNWPSVFLNVGGIRAPWLHLDPGDRDDGESTMPSGEVLRWHGHGTATVLRVGDAS